jgi:hypothetical protein
MVVVDSRDMWERKWGGVNRECRVAAAFSILVLDDYDLNTHGTPSYFKI